MGRTGIEYVEYPTESKLREITWDMDQDGPPGLGTWINFNVNDHVRVIVERIAANRYCTRSLIRSALRFEVIEELAQVQGWTGRLYAIEDGQVIELGRSEDLGDTAFRQLYRSLGGKARW